MERCFGDGDPLDEAYHDEEWGRPVEDEGGLFERLSLEGFQSGLSWRTILRKRPAFREVFAGFDPETVARFDEDDVARLLGDARIVRNRAKIEATIAGARATLALHDAGDSLAALLARHAPAVPPPPARQWSDVPTVTAESTALAAELKRLGFRFIGPTTAYATMQAVGIVNDHLAACPAREAVLRGRRAPWRPASPTPDLLSPGAGRTGSPAAPREASARPRGAPDGPGR